MKRIRPDFPPPCGEGGAKRPVGGPTAAIATPTPDPSPRRVEDAPSARRGGERTQAAHDPLVAKPASVERVARYRRGRFSELLAAALLMTKGYRILARRCRTPYGEIDLIAVRRRRLAFVEVKRRATALEAQAALSPRQAGRIARAAEFWISRNPRYRDHDRGLDAVFVVPGRLPAHVPDALSFTARFPR